LTNNAGHSAARHSVLSALLLALCLSSTVSADINVGAGGSLALNGASIDLGCTDVSVGGTLTLDTGTLTNVRNFTILPGGVVQAGSSQVTLAGDWSNSGTFNAGSGRVNFVDAPACAASSTISGNTSFRVLNIVSGSGKTYRFAAGSTQTVAGMFTLTGIPGNPVQVRSTVPGSLAFIDATVLQNIRDVAVTDMAASGMWLAPYQANAAPGGRAERWFGEPDYARIPTLGGVSLIALCLFILTISWRTFRTSSHRQLNFKDSKNAS